ncbi:putative pectinesterase/pectinesterase inhibitor 45 [Rhodamnia argentea]|uniref:Pectinesterase n=1 Tax=Rhodamnia argentea TaxID=178133 RepID=A0A8B8P6R5_9MYRT|nr:putative pectinesterase/pectinesterase inhibitor 45 [Rhodamnia argentea]
MAFQDFDHLSERRRAERKQKLRKRIAIAVVSSLALAGVVAGCVIAVVQRSGSTKTTSNAAPAEPASQISHSQKMIKMICSSTDYQETCTNTFNKAVKSDANLTQPKDLLKVAIGAAFDEVEGAFNKTKKFEFTTPKEKAAFEDCKQLLEDAVEELGFSVNNLGDSIGKFSSKTPDLNNWLSAVMSYQHACVDGFPDGKLKTEMQKTMKIAEELTSNSLAIISEVSSFLSTFQVPGATRHLLEEEASGLPVVDHDGLPSWMNQEERRMLKGKRGPKLTPNVVVAKDGSGKFKTISEALAAMPEKYTGRYVIYIKEGVYDEYITVTKKMVNVTMYGDGSQKTIVTGNKNFVDGVRTFKTASFTALGEGFMAQAMGFRNTAGPEKHQAVAIRVQSDRAIFLNCRFEGYQDTLYVQTHRQFYRSCVIAGTVDFIFGDATAVFQNCLIVVRKPLDNQQNIVTAQGRYDRRETTGIVLQNCRITADKKLIPVKSKFRTYLGRPWKEFSRTIIMESTIEDFIDPAGWMPWEGEFALKTLYYAEYNNKGPGAKLDTRVKWPGYKKIQKQEAAKFTVGTFLDAGWIKGAGVPVHFGLNN